jgi:hypothetical protein
MSGVPRGPDAPRGTRIGEVGKAVEPSVPTPGRRAAPLARHL